jgi:thioredoxin 1
MRKKPGATMRKTRGNDEDNPGNDEEDDGMTTINLTKDNFDKTVMENDMVVVDFWAPWCGPCRFFSPVFEAASDKHPGIVFGKVNTEEQPDLAGMFGIRSIPTLMILREKVILYSEPGALPESALEEIIGKAQALDMAEIHAQISKDKGLANDKGIAKDKGEAPVES